MVALLVFERFCAERGIQHAEIPVFLDYLWQWPVVDQFEEWAAAKPALVRYGLGEAPPAGLEAALVAANFGESGFRSMVSNIATMLWSNFYFSADDEETFKALETIVMTAQATLLPPLTPFRFSRFEDDGWGNGISREDWKYWLSLREYD